MAKTRITKAMKIHRAESRELLVDRVKRLVRAFVRQGKTNETLEQEQDIDDAVDEQLYDELLQNGDPDREDANQAALFRIQRIIDGIMSR